MNVFGGSQAGETKKIVSDIQSSYKTILHEIKLQKKEIDNVKSDIVNINSLENNVQTNLLICENRMSELFNNYAEISTKIAIISDRIAGLNTEIDRITGIFDENSLPNHGSYISELNSRLNIIEDKYSRKN